MLISGVIIALFLGLLVAVFFGNLAPKDDEVQESKLLKNIRAISKADIREMIYPLRVKFQRARRGKKSRLMHVA